MIMKRRTTIIQQTHKAKIESLKGLGIHTRLAEQILAACQGNLLTARSLVVDEEVPIQRGPPSAPMRCHSK